ncbi:Potassium voltage-gated channel sub H member 8 [Bulinus truncatus]|nr:Potassium voltage-gated channel sub H member 8 [Bulinus truncatus]
MPEYKVQEVKKSGLIIVHYGIFKIGWDWLILLCTFYVAIMVPFNAAFKREGRIKEFIYMDVFVEVMFAIDIVLNFRTTFLNKSGQVVYDSRLIAINYIRGWFLLDLLAAIPFDVLYAFSVETMTMVHLLKVARLLRLARLLQKLERYNQYSVVVLALLMCMFALLAHWLACIWYAIGKAELDDNDGNWTVGWLYELSERLDNLIINKTHNIPDIVTSYLTALYFTCSSLTSVGFGNVSANTNAEKIFSVCAMLVGAIMHAVVFGNVTTIIQRMYARRATFHSKTKDLKDFFRVHHIPKPLKHRMRDYFQAMWSINNGIDFKEILKDFPEDMRGEIAIHLHREILSLPIFQQSPPGCLKSVSLQTERFVCGPGEFIMRKGDAVNYLYYVCSGSMEVLKDEQVVAILGKGDIFGTDLDYDDPVSISGCDVRSLAYCELLCIQVKGLVEALLLYPDFAETFNSELPNDLTYNVREGHEDHSDDESSTAAPVITLPSISEDEEEENEDNNNDSTSKKRSRPSRLLRLPRDDHDEDGGGVEGKGNTSLSPLLSQFSRENSSSEWLAGRGKMPNGHIGATLSMRLANQQSKLKDWISRARKRDDGHAAPSTTPLVSSVPTTPTQPPAYAPTRPKPNIPPPLLSALALRRTASGGNRLNHRRCRDKMKSCRTLPTLNSGSLLRLVSSSPTPQQYVHVHNSLHPSYNPSPSPNPNLYPAPSFYFSQSTDGGDTRDTISLQSGSSLAPEWSGYLSQGKPEQFLSPFQTSKFNFGGGTPSPLVSPRVNFSPGNFPSLSRQSVLSLNNDRIPAVSGLSGDKTGSIKHLHSPNQRCDRVPPLTHADGAKSLFIKPSRSLDAGGPKNNEIRVATTAASASLDMTTEGLDKKNLSPESLNSKVSGFQNEYYQLTQLEPCDARSGHCEKASALRMSDLELSFSSDSPQFDISTTEDEALFRSDKKMMDNNGTLSSRNSYSLQRTDAEAVESFSHLKTSHRIKLAGLYPQGLDSMTLNILRKRQQLTVTSAPFPRAPGDIEYIDAEPGQRPSSQRTAAKSHSPSLSQLPVFTTTPSPAMAPQATKLDASKSFQRSSPKVTSFSGIDELFTSLFQIELCISHTWIYFGGVPNLVGHQLGRVAVTLLQSLLYFRPNTSARCSLLPFWAKSNNYVYSDGIYLAEKYIHKSGIPDMNGQLFPSPRLKDGQRLNASHSMLDILGERDRDIYTAIPCG